MLYEVGYVWHVYAYDVQICACTFIYAVYLTCVHVYRVYVLSHIQLTRHYHPSVQVFAKKIACVRDRTLVDKQL